MSKKKFHWIDKKIDKTPVRTACGKTITAYSSYMAITPPYTTQENKEKVTCISCRKALGLESSKTYRPPAHEEICGGL